MGQEFRDDQMDALRGIAAQLTAATAEASVVIQAVDHFLADELCIGVSAASRPFDSQRALGDDDRELIITSHLAFGRIQGKDRIYVLKATLEKDEWKENFTNVVAEDYTPWASCPRELKLQSFAMLPELLGNLAELSRRRGLEPRRPAPSRRRPRAHRGHGSKPPSCDPPAALDAGFGEDREADELAEDVPLEELTAAADAAPASSANRGPDRDQVHEATVVLPTASSRSAAIRRSRRRGIVRTHSRVPRPLPLDYAEGR